MQQVIGQQASGYFRLTLGSNEQGDEGGKTEAPRGDEIEIAEDSCAQAVNGKHEIKHP